MKIFTLLLSSFLSASVLAQDNLVGSYQQDSYQETDGDSPQAQTIRVEIKKRTFVAYGTALTTDKKSGKQIWDTNEVARGTWDLKGSQLTLKTRFGSCTYEYNKETEVNVPPTKGRGFKFVSKSGKKTEFCKKLFMDTKA